MASNDAAILEEIARLSSAIDQHKAGSSQLPNAGKTYFHPAQSAYSRPQAKPAYRPYPPKANSFNQNQRHTLPQTQTTREVVIDGVTFESRGKSLVRKQVSSSSTTPEFPAKTPATPASLPPGQPTQPQASSAQSSATVNAQPLIRTRNGLVAASLFKKSTPKLPVTKARPYPRRPPPRARPGKPFHKNQTLKTFGKKKIEKQCPRFTMHGVCSFGLTCKYKHDPDKIALCPLFLKGTCPHNGDPSACNLSHDPTPERTPICSRFNATGECWKGTDCLYPHIRLGHKEGVCKDFAVTGFCEKGAQCPLNHVKECPSFAATGKCDRAGLKGPAGCSLPHVIRANKRTTSRPNTDIASTKRKADDNASGSPVDVQTLPQQKRTGHSPDTDGQSPASDEHPEGLSSGFDSEFISLTFVESDEDEDEDHEKEGDQDGEEDADDDDDDEGEDDEIDDETMDTGIDNTTPSSDHDAMYDT